MLVLEHRLIMCTFRTLLGAALCLLFSGAALALTVDLHESEDGSLVLRLGEAQTPQDQMLADGFRATPFMSNRGAGRSEYVVPLDSTPGLSQYLRAARLSGGIYVHLPQLCPRTNCDGVEFVVRARQIMFGGTVALRSLRIRDGEARHAAVFFTNEENPRLSDALYIGAEFSDAAAARLRNEFEAIRKSYSELIGHELIAKRGTLVTLARDREGARGFGGDFLNILRLTFHNRRDEREATIVDLMVRTYAHEVAHVLHPARLVEMSPQGRVVSEGSADFLKVLVLRRTGLIDVARASSMISSAYDACQRRRDTKGLLERVATRVADFREYYDCGMIYYFGLMFDQPESEGVRIEDAFVSELAAAFRDAPVMKGENADCLLMSPACSRSVAIRMLGDGEALKAMRPWFEERLRSHLGRQD
jgi:hypothetical protein